MQSSLGSGSTFRFFVELRSAQAQVQAAGEERDLLGGDGFDEHFAKAHPLRILVAEDSLVSQILMRSYLGKFGYEIILVGDGRAALECIHAQVFDLVILDVQMPEMDGPMVAKRVRAEISPEQQPYIVALTASVMEVERQACLTAGMDDFLCKPLLARDLLRTLEKVLSWRSEKRSKKTGSMASEKVG